MRIGRDIKSGGLCKSEDSLKWRGISRQRLNGSSAYLDPKYKMLMLPHLM